ncbi:hypothetical protein GSI_03634 [Ganoderma sinense ZZ0214-1]|uniref:Uncharacterized protein n=1 Tax=Ganoderma sinense ZZ0214-1 TaxID=1077348 RepID=A0A2G8SJN0_9APHY|nr:hypothetical protein GSI_03634 [Ganoderma sinense ZZ0214-1]
MPTRHSDGIRTIRARCHGYSSCFEFAPRSPDALHVKRADFFNSRIFVADGLYGWPASNFVGREGEILLYLFL